MSISTIGYISTASKDVFQVANAIRGYLKTQEDGVTPPLGYMKGRKFDSAAKLDIQVKERGVVTALFNIGEESRLLYVFFECDSDYSPGPKIIFSLGAWGRAKDVILGVMENLSHLGPRWFDENDCDDVDFRKIG